MVDEEQKQEETLSADNTGEGNKPKELEVITKTNAAAKRLEEANERSEELIRRQEEIIARQELSGETEAGAKPVKKEEETPQEYANNIVSKGENLLM